MLTVLLLDICYTVRIVIDFSTWKKPSFLLKVTSTGKQTADSETSDLLAFVRSCRSVSLRVVVCPFASGAMAGLAGARIFVKLVEWGKGMWGMGGRTRVRDFVIVARRVRSQHFGTTDRTDRFSFNQNPDP